MIRTQSFEIFLKFTVANLIWEGKYSHEREISQARCSDVPTTTTNMLLPSILNRPFAKARLAFSFLALSTFSQAATTLWEVNLDFNEFVGQPGGWDARPTNFNYGEWANREFPKHEKTYNVIGTNGTDTGTGSQGTGRDLYTKRLDASSPGMKLTTQVFSSKDNPWVRLRGGITNQGVSSQMETTSLSSRPGDWGVVAYQFDVPYDVDAKNLSIRLDNVNGSGELYEWAFVTLNDQNIENPGFLISDFGTYGGAQYNDLSSSTYFNADGTVNPGGTAQPNRTLPTNLTISQHLAGQSAGPAAENVNPGWFAADKHNVRIKDGPEAFDSPASGTGWTQNVFDVTHQNLGVSEDTKVNSFTVWMGYHDVAFDTNSDGVTRTGPNSQIGQISGITLGASAGLIPEPSSSLLALITGLGLFARRRR